ncbi:MAG: CcmD family protein [Terriglobales bacterium]
MGSLVAAYTVAWIILMVYVLTLASRQRRLRRALERLQRDQPPQPAPDSQLHAR